MGGFWATALSSVANYFSSKSANDSTNRANLRNTRLNNELQDRLSRTAHQREVKDLKLAGLNPILSARGSGAPQPASASAKVEPKPSLGSAAINAAQIQLLKSQARKTSAEALNTELQEPYNQAMSDVYSSILGVPAVGVKAAGGLASAYGMYRGAKGVARVLSARKKKKLLDLHKTKTKTRKDSSIGEVNRFINSRSTTGGKSGGGFSLRKGFGNRSGRYNKFNKF